ncbi:MAG TPA: hypothetical protein VIM67_05020 [Terriglobus sp.]
MRWPECVPPAGARTFRVTLENGIQNGAMVLVNALQFVFTMAAALDGEDTHHQAGIVNTSRWVAAR